MTQSNPHLNERQLTERRDFILSRLKRGFSPLTVRDSFAKAHDCSPSVAQKWVNWALDQIVAPTDPAARKRTNAIFLEMYHDQIVAYQSELMAMQAEIERVTTVTNRRAELQDRIAETMDARERVLMDAELKQLPDLGYTTRSTLIEAKTRIRERMYRVIADLAQLQGVGLDSDWRNALNVLLDNNLIPPAVAEGILTVINEFESGLSQKADAANALPPDEGDEPGDSWEFPDA